MNGGWIGMKLKNNRRQLKNKKNANHDENSASVETTQTDMDEVLFKMKTLDISKANLIELKNMLKLTFEHRQSLIKTNENLDLLEIFPYFFTNSDLVNKIF